MPRELRDSEQFQKLIPKAVELRVVRGKETVKLKLRTPVYLYTYLAKNDEADALLKSAKDIEVVEITPSPEKKEKSKEPE